MNMKTSLTALTAALLIINSWQVIAASSIDLTVTGLITPSACTPDLSGNGVVDHGKLSAKDLSTDQETKLNEATLQLTVECDAQTLFALRGIDNRAGSSSEPSNFGYGLGLINGVQKLGYFQLMLSNPQADGTPRVLLESVDNSTTWYENTRATWQPLRLAGFGSNTNGIWAPVPIKNLIADLTVSSYIAATKNLELSNEAPIDGSATLEVKYL